MITRWLVRAQSPSVQRRATTEPPVKIALLQVRQQIVVQVQCKLTALRCRCGDVIRLDNVRFGWTGKAFEVTEWRSRCATAARSAST